MKSLIKVWKILVFTNILIAIGAGAQVLLSYAVFQIPYNIYIVQVEFCATLLLYNLSIWMSKPKDYTKSPYERTRWVFDHMSIFWTISLLALTLLLFALTQISLQTLIYFGFIGVISLAYVLPILNFKGERKSFRHLPYIKVFHIALIWSLSTVGLVYIESGNTLQDLNYGSLLYLLLCKFLFIILITLPFDLRDMKQDSYYHLKTVSIALGERKTKVLCYLLLMAHIILVLFMQTLGSIKIGLILCDILVLLLFNFKIFKERNSFLNVYLLDLMLVMQYLICVVCIQIVDNFIR
ncbi:UbiA prenyltransferase family protein [Sphingobacterium bovistauri]|uniref:UbiA prenyltransferase family protein n=1 Tax=Sphingobacterium bovistauri TaxID=2781959 RepID=A0ABS7ZAL2_9SPHI|nr:hypothetical protein [Sphingobacterium bovistauri]MCA5006446.1 hypothetical protein [Sphingobacterium bovistauri]